DRLLLPGLADGAFDERRTALMDQLPGDSIGRRTDAGNVLESVRLYERRDLPVQTEHRLRGTRVPERTRRVTGQRGQVVQQPCKQQVDIHPPHALRPFSIMSPAA